MENKIEEVNARISELEAEATTLEEEDTSGKLDKRAQKYKELEAKDKQMTVFLASYDEEFAEANKVVTLRIRCSCITTRLTPNVPLQKMAENEARSVELMRSISTAIERGAELPDAESYAQDKNLLNFKQNQLNKSEQTAKSLDTKLARLKKDQANVDALESKITVEMANLEEQISTMKSGLVT